MARGGRRRRVLNEEARGASSHLAIAASGFRNDADDGVVQRYGQQAHIENHPQVTDFIPRRKRRVCLIVLTGVIAAAAAQSIVRFGDIVASRLPGVEATELTALAAGLVAWTSAAILAAAALTAGLIHSLRRHRVDDVRGRYRVWKSAAIWATLLSVNAVVHADRVIASAAAAAGWSITASGVEWRLVPAILLGCWVALRMTVDLAESRGALFVMASGLACYAVAVSALLGSGMGVASWTSHLVSTAPLVGHTLIFAAMLLYARYVVLDVQGLIDHEPVRFAEIRAAQNCVDGLSDRSLDDDEMPSAVARQDADARDASLPRAASAHEPDRWIDGSEEAASPGEDDDVLDDRKLSKAQRKKLRKQKLQRRAA